jgi:hypothetical protein
VAFPLPQKSKKSPLNNENQVIFQKKAFSHLGKHCVLRKSCYNPRMGGFPKGENGKKKENQ